VTLNPTKFSGASSAALFSFSTGRYEDLGLSLAGGQMPTFAPPGGVAVPQPAEVVLANLRGSGRSRLLEQPANGVYWYVSFQRDGAAFYAIRVRDDADIWEATPP
jgi:hypothetical protein